MNISRMKDVFRFTGQVSNTDMLSQQKITEVTFDIVHQSDILKLI